MKRFKDYLPEKHRPMGIGMEINEFYDCIIEMLDDIAEEVEKIKNDKAKPQC